MKEIRETKEGRKGGRKKKKRRIFKESVKGEKKTDCWEEEEGKEEAY